MGVAAVWGLSFPYCCTTCTSSWMTEPTASFQFPGCAICPLIQDSLTSTSVPLVAATPSMGLMVIVKCVGAAKPLLARQSTHTGYHWFNAAFNFVRSEEHTSELQ